MDNEVRELFENHIGYRLPDDISNMISQFEDAIELRCPYCNAIILDNEYRSFDGHISGREFHFCSKNCWDYFKYNWLCCKCEREFRLPGVIYKESGKFVCESTISHRFQPGKLLCEDCSEGDIRCLCVLCRQEFKLADLKADYRAPVQMGEIMLCVKCKVEHKA